MATRRREPGRRQEIETMLTERGFTWEYHEDLPLTEFNVDKSLRNQARLGNPLRPDVVERYKSALANGDEFPAIIAATQPSGGHLNIDGNHRFEGHKASGRKGIDTYLIIDGDPQGLTMLTFTCNTTHGLATTEEERIQQALWMVAGGLPQGEAAKQLGIKVSTLGKAVREHQADLRADEMGIDRRYWDKMGSGIKARLHQIATDEGFAAMTKLAIQARLSSAEVEEAVKTLTNVRSSTKQVQLVEALREQWADRIQRGGDPSPRGRQQYTPRKALSMAHGQVLNLPSPDRLMSHMTETDKTSYKKLLIEMRDKCDELVRAFA